MKTLFACILAGVIFQSATPKPETKPSTDTSSSGYTTSPIVVSNFDRCGTEYGQIRDDGRCHFTIIFTPDFPEVTCTKMPKRNGSQVADCVWDAKPEEKK